jgi:hypothetical protein
LFRWKRRKHFATRFTPSATGCPRFNFPSNGYLCVETKVRCLSHIRGWQLDGLAVLPVTSDVDFKMHRPSHFHAEAAVIGHRGPGTPPELPSGFTSDLPDAAGRRDQVSEW